MRFTEDTFKKWGFLIGKAQLGDQDAYKQFLSECYLYIKMVVSQKMGGVVDKDDVTQECLIGIHKSLATYDSKRKLKPWLQGIIRFKIYDYFRKLEKSSKEVAFSEGQNVTNTVGAENLLLEEERGRQWEEVLQAVPELLREALVLTKIKGLSYKEAALELNTSEATLRKRVSRAYGALAKVMRAMELNDAN